MPKTLLSLPSMWTRCLPLMSQRHFGGESTESWGGAAVREGRMMPRTERKCHPREGNCPANVVGACPKMEWPKCGEPDIKPPLQLGCCCDHRLTENVCKRPERKKYLPAKKEKIPFHSMWETGGIISSCPDGNTPLDETHYKASDKIQRTYTRTWNSCLPPTRKRKVYCAHEVCMLPPYEKRPKEEYPQTAKEQDSEQLKLDYNDLKKLLAKNSNTKRPNKCPKIALPRCRKVAKQVKCNRDRRHTDCLKECCPQPSFSECDRNALKLKPPVECRCCHFENQCVADRFLIRKQIFQLPPPLPAWPPKERPK